MNICKHFSECGGCRFQDIDYPNQLVTKEDKVRELTVSLEVPVYPRPIKSGEPWYYRNKMEFSFGVSDGRVACGLYSKVKRRQLVDIEECLIFSPDAALVLAAVKDFASKNDYPVHDKYSHRGFLRNLLIRETKFTNQLMVGIVTTSTEKFDQDEFVKVLRNLKLKSEVKSVFQIVNDSLSDAVIFQEKKLLYGEPFIIEELGEFRFKVGIDSFFQVNPPMAVELYRAIRDAASLTQDQRVLDIFCGLGSIGINLAKAAKFVWGVEMTPEIIDLAWENAKLNHVDNISFFVSDARQFLNTQGAFYKDSDLLVVNPPRCGLSQKLVRAILRLNPKKIIYSSCNPTALFTDLRGLLDQYKLEFIGPFDFFPHTAHLEVLTFLQLK
ncbi:MAG: 23S rRNA (uracil(1939)-C(5))-methyltransferase RlmD [Candidatus Omnitrophica bacterium]|nr:23S rRNA (uracil(1939)-C(5))-methyltransferase RlmD [Candidatus Omnitrophota bacterium]